MKKAAKVGGKYIIRIMLYLKIFSDIARTI